MELALQRSLQRQQFAEMRSARLSPQRDDNCLVGKRFGELDHAAQVLRSFILAVNTVPLPA